MGGWAQRDASGCTVELNVIESVGSSRFRGQLLPQLSLNLGSSACQTYLAQPLFHSVLLPY